MTIFSRKQMKIFDRMFRENQPPDGDPRWLEVMAVTWNKYRGTNIGEVMRRRYVRKEEPLMICESMGIKIFTFSQFLLLNKKLVYLSSQMCVSSVRIIIKLAAA